MLDLTKLPAFYLEAYGRDKVAETLGKSPSVVAMWAKSGKFPLEAVQRLLEFDPSPLGAVTPLWTPQPLGKKLAILLPCTGSPTAATLECVLRLWDRADMNYRRMAFNNLSVVRNSLAAWALREGYEWFFWCDADNFHPCGDVEAYRENTRMSASDVPDVFAGVNTIYRMLVHKKTVVSCVYTTRRKGGIPQFGGGSAREMIDLIKKGPRNKLIEVGDWCGFGGVLTHRKVFEDIIATQGDQIRVTNTGLAKRFGYEYAFFHPVGPDMPGDDISFCHRARAAGHKIHVDLAVFSAHVGEHPYTHKDL